jgi:hypothetical protein
VGGGANCAGGGKVGVTIVLMVAYLMYIVTVTTGETQSGYTALFFFFDFTEDVKYFWVRFLKLI